MQKETLADQEVAREGARSSASPTDDNSARNYMDSDLQGDDDEEATREDRNSKEIITGREVGASGPTSSLDKERRSMAPEDSTQAPKGGQGRNVPLMVKKTKSLLGHKRDRAPLLSNLDSIAEAGFVLSSPASIFEGGPLLAGGLGLYHFALDAYYI